jgi:hypothetical protein
VSRLRRTTPPATPSAARANAKLPGSGIAVAKTSSWLLALSSTRTLYPLAAAQVAEPVAGQSERRKRVGAAAAESSITVVELVRPGRFVGDFPDGKLERRFGHGAVDNVPGRVQPGEVECGTGVAEHMR